MADEELLLSSRRPGRPQVRAVVTVALLLSLGFLISLPFLNYPLGRSYPILPVIFTTEVLAAALTATLLFSQAAVIRSWSLIALGTGYLFSALIVIPEALTYAHAFAEKRLLSAGLSTSTWLYLFWHTGFPIAVMSYAALKTRDAASPMRREQVRPTVVACIAGTAALVTLLTILAIVGEPWLPQQMTDAFSWAWPSAALFAAVPLALFVGALVAISGKERSVLDLWLALVLWSWLLETTLGLLTTGRFTVGWYVGVLASVLSEALILALLLAQSNRLYAQLAVLVSTGRREREGRSLTMNAVAAAMAHEVKQPLTAIVANAGAGLAIIQQAPANITEAAELFHLIEQDGHRAAEVVGSIRAMFAHRSSEKRCMDINELLRETTALVAGELAVGQVGLDLALDERMPLSSIDRVQMKHVFLNLIANAIEAMTSVTARPRILAIRTISNDAGVQISVQDSGTGIDAGYLDRIFEPFFTTKSQGTGMGLSLSRSIIEGHGGSIWATADQAFGTTFHVRLPPSRPSPGAAIDHECNSHAHQAAHNATRFEPDLRARFDAG